jgi:cbb3-type cytochrome oxidase subunit 3
MRLTDIMSHSGLAIYAEIGLVLFVIAFIVIAIRIFRPSARQAQDRASRLPLDDGTSNQSGQKEDDV